MNDQNVLFHEYEEIKPLLRIGALGLARYEKPIAKKKGRGITNERQSIVKEFADEINRERASCKMDPLTDRYVAVKLGILKSNRELYEFLSECRDYKKRNGSFGKRFFGGFIARVDR